MKHIFFVLILITLLAACSPAAKLPEQFETWRLPAPGAESDTRMPVVWLGADGTEAVLGTGSSFTIASKDPNDPQVSGMPASPAEMGDELATANLAAETNPVIIISDEGGSIQSVSASVQSWVDISPENFALFTGRQVQGSGKQSGDIFTYTLEPLGTVEDRLLVVSIVFDNSRASGDIVVIWRLNPGAAEVFEQSAIVSPGGPALDYVSFVDALQAGGATVEPAGTFGAAFFTGNPLLITVNGGDIQVYEYADPALAEKEARDSAPDGESIILAEWIATPHFYQSGRIIVQYIGDDPDIIALLESLLGPQFAGGPVPATASTLPTVTVAPTATAVPTSLPATPAPTLEPTPAAALPLLDEKQTIDSLNPTAQIKIPFVRNGSIYLYEDGQEKLVSVPSGTSSRQACFNLVYPFLSPDGKTLAYLDQAGEPADEFWGCLRGYLRIVDLSTGIDIPTRYKILSFQWTPTNLLHFRLDREFDEKALQIIEKEIFFDPLTQEEHQFVTLYAIDSETYAETMLVAEYPSDQLTHLIQFKEDNYYLVDVTQNEETLLFSKDDVFNFIGWSPSGRYALFDTWVQVPDIFGVIEWVIDTQNPGGDPVEIAVGRGAAGGDIPAGRKWYFEAGFVAYCREELYFIDGRSPLQLTNDGGGGCNNEEGFVATSPGGEYALLKFQERFELHHKQGNVVKVEEIEPLVKARGIPKNFIWINDDFMIIYESAYGYNYGKRPTIFLFDRQANIITPVIENAYLIDANT